MRNIKNDFHRCKRNPIKTLTGLLLIGLSTLFFTPSIPSAQTPMAPRLYDDFSGALIDPAKWSNLEFVRRINAVAGVLELESELTAYNSWVSNPLYMVNPNSVTHHQADVTVKQVDNNNAWLRARVGGYYYRDSNNTFIHAQVGIKHEAGNLKGYYGVVRCFDQECSAGAGGVETLLWGEPSDWMVSLNETKTISIEWKESTKFTFNFQGGNPVTVDAMYPTFPVNPAPNNGPIVSPYSPWRGFDTRVSHPSTSGSGGHIKATFDNVFADNGSGFAPYDDFSSGTIDSERWLTYEYERRNSEGAHHSKIKTGPSSGSSIYNNLQFKNPSSINVIQATVTPLDIQNYPDPTGGSPMARIAGYFYHDGIVNVGAAVNIIRGASSSDLYAYWVVFSETTPGIQAGPQQLLGPPGYPHTLLLGWDGSKFTFMIDNTPYTYTPSTSIHPPNILWKEISTRAWFPSGKEGIVEALFDDVMTNEFYTLTVSKTGAGTGTVTSSPTGINCGSDCIEIYASGTPVTLTATPDDGSSFAGWSGSGCSGTDPCTVTMDALKSVVATFKANTTTTVSSSLNPSVYCDSVTFTATVTPSTATGTVQFKIDGGDFGSPVTLVNGSALSAVTTLLAAGNHTITADYSGDANYNTSGGILSDGQTVNKANASINVAGYTGYYDCNAHGATGTATGVCTPPEDLTNGLNRGDMFTNVPGGTAHWTFSGGINYNDASGDVAIVINKADATINITPYDVTYNCNPHTATGTATGVCGETLSGLDLSSTTHTNAGPASSYSYTDTWTFTDVTGNYNNASDTVVDTINRATPVITWADPADITYPTALGDAQLNATASGCDPTLTGSFVYNPESCTVLEPPPISSSPLSVTFIPDVTPVNYQINYTNASATVHINVLVPRVSSEKVGGLWICTQSDASGYPVATYVCTTDDCSSCMTNPTTNPNRCEDSSVFDVTFSPTELKWAGPGSGGTVDFVTSQTVSSQTQTIVYRCVEGMDLCFSCGDPRLTWTCDPEIRQSLLIPAFSKSLQERVEDVWVCAGEVDQSGCFTNVYSCPAIPPPPPGQPPCACQTPVPWVASTVLDVQFALGDLKWGGPSGSNPGCETVYFVTLDCIYKCSSDTGHCFSYCP